ncbi:MAG: protein-disulfide reductase DsbD [Candidatus Riflebacteria bacterium]|nr:protein-disulfide reductase DsbD [Candidatus Riflebacteria bacterium]
MRRFFLPRFPLLALLASLAFALTGPTVPAARGGWLTDPETAGPFSFRLSPVVEEGAGRLVGTLTIAVAPDHHLYRERTKLEAEAGSLTVAWPPAKVKVDPFENKPVEIFDAGEHQVGFSLTGWPVAASPALTLDWHGCSSQTCFMPERKTFPVAWPADRPTGAPAADPAAPARAAPSSETRPEGPAAPLPAAATPAGQSSQAAPAAAAAIPPTAAGEVGPSATPAPSRGASDAGAVATPGGTYDFGRTLRERGLAWALLVAFLGGFLVSLTPCVYPMIPITLSIIGGRQENTSFGRGLGLSVTYVAGLSLTYALLGLIVAVFGAQVRGLLQGPTFQLGMAVIFVLLALSMFDLFLLQVPDTLRQRFVGVRSTGPGGIFLLGMVSGLMASPCVAAPLAGILAFIAASGSLLLGFTMLLAFAWGMGLILVLIGAFSGSLNALPRAGDWMVTIKEFYGFLLLGAAFYFAQPFIGSPWAGLLTAALLAAFAGFLGLFRPVSAEARLGERVSRCLGVVALAVACAFAVSSAGQWGLCLQPPEPAAAAAPAAGLPFWHDRLADGLAQAAREGKPVFVDFRADWCTICLELEKTVFPHPDVAGTLQKYVLVKIDATDPDEATTEVLRQFVVVGLPTLVVLGADGRERPGLRVTGDVAVADLTRLLREGLRP